MADHKIEDENEINEEEFVDVYTLTDEEGKEEQFELLSTVEYRDHTYYALMSVDHPSEGEYVILREGEEDGEIVLETIDDDEEFDAVEDLFEDQIFTDIDYDEDAIDDGN